MRRFVGFVTLVALALLTGCPRVTTNPATPPEQPDAGPGSSATTNSGMKTTRVGNGVGEYFIYEPTNPSPATAPVIAFIHAFGAVNPRAYGGWITHMVKNGNIVIFPVYQVTLNQPDTYTPNALAALLDAFTVLNSGNHAKPDMSRFAFVSHSLGGPIALNLAAIAVANGLPKPRAAFLTNPGDSDSVFQSFGTLMTDNYDQIPADMQLIIIVGEDDTIAGTGTAIKLYNNVPQIPEGLRQVIEFHSDAHGEPPLSASHSAPLAIDQSYDSGESLVQGGGAPPGLADLNEDSTLTDSLDFFGYWKISDGLFQAAFLGSSQVVDDGGVQDLSMGQWSDGTAVKPATVLLP